MKYKNILFNIFIYYLINFSVKHFNFSFEMENVVLYANILIIGKVYFYQLHFNNKEY